MSLDDWEATCCIYDESTTTALDTQGRLVRGSIELQIPLDHLVFCRRSSDGMYRFWILHDNNTVCEEEALLRFRVEFWCTPQHDNNDYDYDDRESIYQRVQITLLSEYPLSFPSKDKWLNWIQREAQSILLEEKLSYSVCIFVEHRALEYFECLFQDHEHGIGLILFQDEGPAFYDRSTIVATHVKEVLPLARHSPSGTTQTISDSADLSKTETTHILPLLLQWKEWLPILCPVCFDFSPPQESATITCGHHFCRDCISTYLRFKAEDELNAEKRTNPFVCPLTHCRHGMKLIGCVKQFLEDGLMNKVRKWAQDVKNPPCWSLPDCLNRDCQSDGLRREAVDSYIVYCDDCKGRWCELCLRRAPQDRTHDAEACKTQEEVCMQFCERYLTASDKAKERCESKWPWIRIYAKSRIDDHATGKWIKNNGQRCPGCKLGIERVEGCFHMSCQCGTHFCYECGEEIFPPFYGTHHCWERRDFGMP